VAFTARELTGELTAPSGEKRVAVIDVGMDEREVEEIAKRQAFLVNALPAAQVDVAAQGLGLRDGLGEAGCSVNPGRQRLEFMAEYHDITRVHATGPLGKTARTHDDGLAAGFFLKKAGVLGNRPR